MSSLLPQEGEYLTTGWESGLDPADSVIRQGIDVHVSWARALAEAARGRFVDRPGWCAGSGGTTTALLNFAIVRQPPGDTTAWRALVEEIVAAYPQQASVIVLSPFPTPDLRGVGVGLVGHPPFMMRPTATVTEPPVSTLEVRSAMTPQELRHAERVFIDGYPLPDMADLPPGQFYRPDVVAGPTRIYVAYDGGLPVATSAAHSAAGLTVVENVAVLGTARGKGAGAAITWAATTAWPDQPAVLIASDDGQPVYERLGFLRLVRWTCWVRP